MIYFFDEKFDDFLTSQYNKNIQSCSCNICNFCRERQNIYLANIHDMLYMVNKMNREYQFQTILYIIIKITENSEHYREYPNFLQTCFLMIDNMKKIVSRGIIQDEKYKQKCLNSIHNFENTF